jgi:hypothetical protein
VYEDLMKDTKAQTSLLQIGVVQPLHHTLRMAGEAGAADNVKRLHTEVTDCYEVKWF